MHIAQLGKYKIRERLGQGAMGEVFRARDPVLGRDVAIKVVAATLTGDAVARQRFLREARAAALLNHPNIVTIYDFGEEMGLAYMAMELLEGSDLRRLIETDGITSLREKLSVVEQILDGLAFAHSKGVVHRDLKPGNIHVLPNGKVKVMDFGLARREQDPGASGALMGTPYYMAPEQLLGQPATSRTDVFSLGVLVYELLSGRRPFTGASIPAVLYAVAHSEPEPLGQVAPDLPPALGPFLARALSKTPDSRFADAGEMLMALRSATTAAEAPPAPPPEQAVADEDAPARTPGPPPSARGQCPPEMEAALAEIESYLADRLPPLMVSDSVGVFARSAVPDAAAEIWAWAHRQQQGLDGTMLMADLLFHALHKLSVLGELDLVDKQALVSFLRLVGAELVAALPPGERDRLRRGLRHLGESEMVRSGPVEALRRPEEPPASTATPGLRRLTLLEQRLRRGFLGPVGLEVQRQVASQAIAAAANEATSERELEDHLRRLRSAGVASGAEQVFRSLGEELRDWALPPSLEADTTELGPSNELRAMKQLVSLPEDPVEVARRYRNLVTAATYHFNAGNLGAAVQMFELASKLEKEKNVESGYTEPLRRRGHEALDPVRIRQYIERAERHQQLQSVMAFFGSSLGPETLLDEMEGEERRDRRRLLLDMLLVHGERARTLVLSRLLRSVDAPASDFARRNWIYLLRLLPRPAAEPPEREIEAVSRFAGPGNPSFLVKEAVLYLGHSREASRGKALVNVLHAWEDRLQAGVDAAGAENAAAALDRIAAILARQGSGAAWAALVEHGLSRDPKLGATAQRLLELGSHDLSKAPDVLGPILDAVRESLPRGVLGRLVARRDQELPALVGALAGTHTPEVREALEEIVRRLPSTEAGRVASRALAATAATPPAPVTSGELEPYAVPAILYRLTEACSTGTLTLTPAEGAGVPATIGLQQGRIVFARWAARKGLEAVYQLFERPFAGRHSFDPSAVPLPAPVLADLHTVVVEGVRRAREMRRVSAIVPQDLPLEATGTAPGTVVEEQEYELIVALWQKACSGMSAEAIEAEASADAFRVLRPLAQWLEEGALRIAIGTAGELPRASEPQT